MSLANTYAIAVSRIPDIFQKIRDGQAPDQVTNKLLKDWGFSSSNDRKLIPILKAVGFLSPDGKPTSLYHDYRDHSRSKIVMGQALKSAYADLFLIKEHPTNVDKKAIKGKFKSYHNTSDNVADLMMKTFYALLELADLKTTAAKPQKEKAKKEHEDKRVPKVDSETLHSQGISLQGLHYNIQIHLPATKDLEVYNAIFKSLKEHFLEK